MSNIWSLTNLGVTKTSDVWGIAQLKRHRESAKTGTVTFTVPGNADNAPIFPQWKYGTPIEPSWVTITRDGTPWFQGIVTKIPRKLAGSAESQLYEISDPWFFFETTTFQQMWAAISGTVGGGAGTATESTLVSRILATRSLDGVKLDLGQVMNEVLIYLLYAVQGVAFPGTVDLTTHLPVLPPSTGTFNPPPYQIDALTPTITVPYFEFRDGTCAEVMRHLLKMVPDAVQWFDHSTTPPTLNIDQRATLTGKTIKVLTSDFATDDYGTTGFNATERDDLCVPVVVAKYESSTTIDGKSDYFINVDSYPAAPSGYDPSAWLSQPGGLGPVNTIAEPRR